ncbi:MAG TPA: peptidoglycan DD-metalloendopeptidase family protein [Alphaproteobacteria bacterium]|nr:peptidoglycan DD-metalloendopeptidase family protein [Alphaproteobacteria bacterium]
MPSASRHKQLRAALAAFVFACPLIAVPALAEDAPLPTERPAPASDELQSNAPSTAAEDIARLKADIAQQRATRDARDRERHRLEFEAAKLKSKSIGLATQVQSKELAVSLSEDNLDVLNQREAQILAKLKLGRSQLTDTLAALELMEKQKPPALAMRPEDATDAVRSAILLSDIVPRLTAQANALAKELKNLQLVRDKAAQEHKTLLAATQDLKANQAALASVLADRDQHRLALGVPNSAEAAQAAELGQKSRSLGALVQGLKTASQNPSSGATSQDSQLTNSNAANGGAHDEVWASAGSEPMTFADARGHVRMPAVGKVVEKFGVPNDSGGLTKGIKIGTLPGAQVIAPFDGRVKYAGPLKTYGNVLIVEADGDYLIILAGLAHVDADVGQWLLAGEPIGRMAGQGEAGPKELYLEFRRAREPFDPLPWLAGVTKEG